MQAEYSDLGLLMEMQQLDLEIMQSKKKRAELPQRIKVMMLRKKRDEIQSKLDQVNELYKKASAENTILEDEDRALAEKQERAQELIDAAGSDYRKVESHSKEMAAAAQRRESLSAKLADMKAQIDKINAVKKQLEDAIVLSESEEAKLRASFEEQDKALIERIRECNAQRAEILAQLPKNLGTLYEKTAAKVGGVAIGRLLDNTCGVCRTPIDGGRLIDLKASAPLGVCPNCQRLLVIDED